MATESPRKVALAMDVIDEEATTRGVEQILAEAGRIDVLVNNAGYGSYGALEDVPLDEARRQFEVNVFGAARLTQLVLPGMRKRRSGTIINVTSMGGKITTPFGAWYHGTKFALEAVSDCLRLEVQRFGIDVVIVEPGAIRTEWSGIAAEHLRATSSHGAYAKSADKVATSFDSPTTARRSSPPEVVAKVIVKAATVRRPRTRYAVGFGAKPLIVTRVLLSDRGWDSLIRRVGAHGNAAHPSRPVVVHCRCAACPGAPLDVAPARTRVGEVWSNGMAEKS